MSRRIRPSRLTYRFLEVSFSLAFFGVVAHHVAGNDFRPLVALGAPILVIYYGFSSLLFVRGKALADGPWQMRSMHAAERAMQATVWHLLGIVSGVGVYGLLRHLEAPIQPGQAPQTALALLFLGPYAFMQAGLLSFLRAVWALVPHLTRRVSAFEVRRRVVATRREDKRAAAPEKKPMQATVACRMAERGLPAARAEPAMA